MTPQRRVRFILLLFLMNCAPSPTVAPRTVVSVAKLDCADCGVQLAQLLAQKPGVRRTRFDRRRAELVVLAEPGFDVLKLARELSRDEKYELLLGPGKGSYLPAAPMPAGLDVAWVARDGLDVADLGAHRVAEKVTVMEFGAVWCEPCRAVDRHMVSVLERRGDIAYRKLDIGDWDSALAKHYLGDAPALPFLVVFGKDGSRVDAFGRLDLVRLDRAIAEGGAR